LNEAGGNRGKRVGKIYREEGGENRSGRGWEK